jgi:hypothetical protein
VRWKRLKVLDIGVGGLRARVRGAAVEKGERIEVRIKGDGKMYTLEAEVLNRRSVKGWLLPAAELHLRFMGNADQVERAAFDLIYRMNRDAVLIDPGDFRRLGSRALLEDEQK